MDLLKTIAKEHSKANTTKIVNYIGADPVRFNDLVSVFLTGPYRITQRAAWPLAYCVEHYPELIKPHLSKVIDHLKKSGIHDAVKRNTLRLLQFIRIPKNLQGKTADLCLHYLGDTGEPIAVKVFSMSVLGNMAKEYTELKNELIPLIEDQLPFAGAAFRSRGLKLLRELRK